MDDDLTYMGYNIYGHDNTSIIENSRHDTAWSLLSGIFILWKIN